MVVVKFENLTTTPSILLLTSYFCRAVTFLPYPTLEPSLEVDGAGRRVADRRPRGGARKTTAKNFPAMHRMTAA